MIDTHCHIFSEYYDDIPRLIDDIKTAGVEKIIVNGTDMKSNLEVLEMVSKYDFVYGAIGFHPTELNQFNEDYILWLEEHINDNKIVALGEIGLDYHYDDTDKEKQKWAFKKQLDVALKYKKPIIVHSRDSIKDTLDILKLYNLTGSMHCYSGSLEMAYEFIKMGYYISIGGVVTYKNVKNLINVIKNIDMKYFILETDSPYLSPEGKRGKINSPCNIPIIASKIAEIKDLSTSKVAKITTQNAMRLFDF